MRCELFVEVRRDEQADSTTRRPATTVCQAEWGPVRSQPSMRSSSTPEDRAVEFPDGDVADRPDRQLADLADAAKATGTAAGGDLQGGAGIHCVGAALQLALQHGKAGLLPQRGGVGRRGSVAAEADVTAGVTKIDDGGDARRQDHVELGQWAIPTPAAPSRATSSGFGMTT